MKSVRKLAAGLVLAGITFTGAMSLTAAGDEEVLATIPTIPTIVETSPADPEPVAPTPEPEPVEPSPAPAVPVEPAPELTPDPEPPFEYVEGVPWVPGAPIGDLPPAPIQEDDPAFDCRYMGNQQCGVEIHGTWYVISFAGGQPSGVALR